MYSRALQADALDSLLNLCYSRIQDLRIDFSRVQVKDSAIIANYDNQIRIAEFEKKLLLETIASKDKEIKRERRKRKVATFLGLATTGAAIYLLTLK